MAVTKGAIFDYEEIVCFQPFDFPERRNELERLLAKALKTTDGPELRLLYTDKRSGKELLLFIRKGYRFGIMQMWILEGICESKDYEAEMERDGSIRKWLEVEIE